MCSAKGSSAFSQISGTLPLKNGSSPCFRWGNFLFSRLEIPSGAAEKQNLAPQMVYSFTLAGGPLGVIGVGVSIR